MRTKETTLRDIIPQKTRELIGEIILNERKRKGMTRAELAQRVGLKRQSIFLAEAGEVSLPRQLAVLKALGFKLTLTISSPDKSEVVQL